MIGSAALVALPFTSGYYSKHAILLSAYGSDGGFWLWAGGTLGALLTGIYSFRLIFVAFFGPENQRASEHLGLSMGAPLVILGALSLVGGFLTVPLDSVFGDKPEHAAHSFGAEAMTTLMPFVGVTIAVLFYLTRTFSASALATTSWGRLLHRFWFSGWGLDWLYWKVFVDPFKWLARVNRADAVDGLYQGIVLASRYGHQQLAATQTGQLRWYAAVLAGGALLAMTLGLWP
jgi:NADH-quinone oxidoreductase subunit L